MMHECDIKVNEFISLTFKEDLDSLRSSSITAAGGRHLNRLGWYAYFCDIGLLSAGGYTGKRRRGPAPILMSLRYFFFSPPVLTQSDRTNLLSWLKRIEQITILETQQSTSRMCPCKCGQACMALAFQIRVVVYGSNCTPLCWLSPVVGFSLPH